MSLEEKDAYQLCAEETAQHIRRVQELLAQVISNLLVRSRDHDKSKFSSAEFHLFAGHSRRLVDVAYGSDAYKACLAELKPAIEHHYQNNPHHPEYHGGSLEGMNILDLLEMLADWKAAGERHSSGSLQKSLEINQKRFGMSDEISRLLFKTAWQLGWI